jgi:hypothetical protein
MASSHFYSLHLKYFTGILANYRSTLTPSFLYSILTYECESLQQGRTTNSLLHKMHASIKFTLFPLVAEVVKTICSNYALEAISNIGNNKEKQELLSLVINTITPPPLDDILSNNLNTIATLSVHFRFPSITVLYDVISARLLSLLRIATCDANSQELIQNDFKRLVKNDRINPAVNFINNHPNFLLSFKHDFIKRTLQLTQIKDKWLEICAKYLETLHCGSDIVQLYLTLYQKGNILSSFGILLHPLLDMKDPDALITNIFKRMEEFNFNPEDFQKFHKVILNFSVDALWNRLRYLFTATGSPLTENWLHVFHQFHMQHPHHNALINFLEFKELLHFDIMTIMFFYASATNEYALQEASEWVDRAAFITEKKYLGLEHFVPLISNLSSRSKYCVFFLFLCHSCFISENLEANQLLLSCKTFACIF